MAAVDTGLFDLAQKARKLSNDTRLSNSKFPWETSHHIVCHTRSLAHVEAEFGIREKRCNMYEFECRNVCETYLQLETPSEHPCNMPGGKTGVCHHLHLAGETGHMECCLCDFKVTVRLVHPKIRPRDIWDQLKEVKMFLQSGLTSDEEVNGSFELMRKIIVDVLKDPSKRVNVESRKYIETLGRFDCTDPVWKLLGFSMSEDRKSLIPPNLEPREFSNPHYTNLLRFVGMLCGIMSGETNFSTAEDPSTVISRVIGRDMPKHRENLVGTTIIGPDLHDLTQLLRISWNASDEYLAWACYLHLAHDPKDAYYLCQLLSGCVASDRKSAFLKGHLDLIRTMYGLPTRPALTVETGGIDDDLERAIALSLQSPMAGGGAGAPPAEDELPPLLSPKTPASYLAMAANHMKPSSERRMPHLRCGLQNNASLCYWNALLQSYYHILPFRRTVLGFRTDSSAFLTPPEKFMLQLNVLFSWLTAGVSKAYTSLNVLDALRKTRNEDTAKHRQQDVAEYMSHFIDQAEKALKDPAAPNISPRAGTDVERLFNGKTRQVVKYRNALGEPCKSETDTTYNHIILEVPNPPSDLTAALTQFCEPQKLYDYEPEPGRPTEAIMDVRFLNSLPPVLTFQMKRCSFNLTTGAPQKVGTRLTFGQELYMGRFLHDNRDQAEMCKMASEAFHDRVSAIEARLRSMMNYQNSTFGQSEVLRSAAKILEVNQREDVSGYDPTADPIRASLLEAAERLDERLESLQVEREQAVQSLRDAYAELNTHCYRLHAVIIHRGQPNAGHYWSFVRVQEQWLRFDDEHVSLARWEDVTREGYGGTVDDPSAACLIYTACDGRENPEEDLSLIAPALKATIDEMNRQLKP